MGTTCTRLTRLVMMQFYRISGFKLVHANVSIKLPLRDNKKLHGDLQRQNWRVEDLI